jgi:hypothetical protein
MLERLDDIMYLVIAIVTFLAVVTLTVFQWIDSRNECENVSNLIYKGSNQGAGIYYSIDTNNQTFNTLDPITFESIVRPVDTESDQFSVVFEFNSGIQTVTQFTKGETLNTAVVIVDADLPSQRSIELEIITMKDLNMELRLVGGIRNLINI